MKELWKVFLATAAILLFRSVMVGAEPAKYPLRAFIAQDSWQRTTTFQGGISTQVTNGEGHGNISEGDSVRGFDFTYSCEEEVKPSTGDPLIPLTGYQGRWKKDGTRLALLITEIGNPRHQSECELKTSVVDTIYSISQGRVVGLTRQQYDETIGWRKAFDAMTHPADTDTANFPLTISILESQWQNHAGGGVLGEGRGDVRKGDSEAAVTFIAPRCVARFGAEPQHNIFRARWIEEPTRLLVLGRTVGAVTGEGFNQCEFQANLQPDNVFVKNSATGAILMFTQEQNKARLQAARATQQASAPAKPVAAPAANGNKKLSVVSNPEGADIEIDGAFMGSTPSVLELSPGEHNVAIRKQGYQPWERRLKLAGGDVKLSADLEKAPSGK